MEQIDSGQIHLWLAFLDEITDPHLLAEYRLLLSREELQQQQRFYFERDKHRFLVTRALVRTVLSKYAEVAANDWTFTVNAHGRPSIAAEHPAAKGIEFNLSHTDGIVAMGVTRERALGVDVENRGTQRAALEIADRFFAPEEVAALRGLPPSEQAQRFFEYWTLKESYIKARGLGLSIPLDRFAFHLDDASAIRLSLDPVLNDRAERWVFWQIRLEPHHFVAVCVASPHGAVCQLTVCQTVPLSNESALDLSVATCRCNV